MVISFVCNYVNTYDQVGWEPTDTRLSGTERGVVEWSEELVNKGHKVKVFRNGHGNEIFPHINGVSYFPREDYVGDGDVCINIKSPEQEPLQSTIFYTNNTDATELDLSSYQAVIQISNWAKNNVPVNNPNVFVVPHGYDETDIYPEKKINKQCLYASSPDRGLDTLLRAWPRIVKIHPDAMLIVTYGYQGPEYKGIYYLGDIDEQAMNELYRKSEFWIHPANGGELQCISGMKAQAAGCWPIYFPVMALNETVKFGTRSNPDRLADDVISSMWDNYKLPKPLPKQPTIADSTDNLLDAIKWVLGNKKCK